MDETREGGAESNQTALDKCIKLSKKKINKKRGDLLGWLFLSLSFKFPQMNM